MNKRIWICGLILGGLLILATLIFAQIATSQTNVIGGADWPTYRFHFRRYSPLAKIGAVVSVVSLILLVRKK